MALRAPSNDKKQKDAWVNRLNNEADGLRIKLNQVEETKSSLSNNRHLRESQEKYEQQIQMLESDKISLMKRLNMVLSELEKATHDKAEINAKLIEQERMAGELKRKLEEVSSLKNVVNRNLQEDLRYERDLNDKLREELTRFEREKEQLIGKLKDQEALSSEIQRETNAINQNLQRKVDELRRLEREHEINLSKLRDLTNMLDSLRAQEIHSATEKRRMEDELEDLTRERNELIRRMNELSDKYEDYVQTMNRERLEIMKANKNHVKLLTAKLLFQIFQDIILRRKKSVLQEVKGCSDHIQKMEAKMIRFSKVMANYYTNRKAYHLRKWYRRSMNFVHENYKKLNLVQFQIDKKRKIKFLFKWRQAFLQKQQAFESRQDSLKSIRNLLDLAQDKQLRKYMCRWRDFVELRQYQHDFMFQTMNRRRQRNLRNGFVTWLAHTKKQGLNERYDKMSELVTNLWFKQRVFLALRQAALESKCEANMVKFKAWKSWCENARKQKYFDRKEQLVQRLEGTRNQRLLKQCFDAIKFGNIQSNFEATKARLEQEIPIREELERKRETLMKTNKAKDKYNLFRSAFIRYADLKFRAFSLWKENVEYHNNQMDRVKLRIIELHKRNLSQAFFRWKEGADKKQVVELVSFTEDLMNENQELKNSLENFTQKKEQLEVHSLKQQGSKLERIRNMINRNLMRHRFTQWATSVSFIGSVETGAAKGAKIIQRRQVRNAFNKYKKQVQQSKRLEYVRNKVEFFGVVRDRKDLANCIDAWKSYIQQYKLAKAFLKRSIIGVDKLIENDAFAKWKKHVYEERKNVYIGNIQELERRQEEHSIQIEELNKQIQVNESTQKHLESKLQTQSHKIMANFISRFIYSSQAKGFYTWLDVLKDQNHKKRFLRAALNYWSKNSQAKAFRTWAEFSLKSQEQELAQKLKDRESERRNLQQQKDEEEKAQTNECQDLESKLQEAIALKEQIKVNYQKALETHIGRIKNNTYIDKKQNIFCVWADFIKREKNAINVIGAIARKNLRMEVFSRIRLAARERWLDQNANKVLTNFTRLFKAALLRKAFSKWRVVNYGEVVNEMEEKQQLLKDTKQEQKDELERMTLQKQAKAERIIRMKRLREISNAWIGVTKRLKEVRVKQQVMRENLDFIKMRNASRKWAARTKLTKYLRHRDNQVVKKYQQRTLKACFQGWASRKNIEKLLCQRITKFGKRHQHIDLAHGFSQIVHYTKSFQERIKERKKHGNLTIFNSLAHLYRQRMTDSFLALKNRVYRREFKGNFMAKTIKHCLAYRLKHYFEKWQLNVKKIQLAETINTEGNVVLERNQMARNVQALKDFLKNQGYSEQDLEEFLQNKSDQQRSTMHKAIVSLFFKNSEFKIVPTAFNQWKRWLQQRKMCKEWALFVINGLNHPLHFAFRQWKYADANALAKLKTVTKKDMVNKIISDELAIGSAQSRVQRMEDAIESLNVQRDSLLQHYISGQKLALALGKNNHLKSMLRAFIRWKKFAKQKELETMDEQLMRTNQMINDLMGHVGKLEGINRNLLGENEELRQAALDGIEIAKAVQELTKEREQLSVDLQDRASTIKKLIEDNNQLSLRLSIAQKEAEQLEQLNQQSFMAPPERDRYF